MPLPPMVSFTRTKNLRDILVRAKLPPPPRRIARNKPVGFKRCNRRSNCALCQHSQPGIISSYTCPFTNQSVNMSSNLTCSDKGVYLVICTKDTGPCNQVCPTYVRKCDDGHSSSFTHRFAHHLGSAMQPGQVDTVKAVGRHFRLPGHDPHRDMLMIPFEKISDSDPFIRKARESLYIDLFKTQKRKSVFDIEHGLNLQKGQ